MTPTRKRCRTGTWPRPRGRPGPRDGPWHHRKVRSRADQHLVRSGFGLRSGKVYSNKQVIDKIARKHENKHNDSVSLEDNGNDKDNDMTPPPPSPPPRTAFILTSLNRWRIMCYMH